MFYWKFPYDYNDCLTTMGVSWFVSYSYYKYIDKSHKNWQRTAKGKNRYNIEKFNESKRYHYKFLKNIIKSTGPHVNANKLGLSSDEIKNMARRLLFRYFVKYSIISLLIVITAIIVLLCL